MFSIQRVVKYIEAIIADCNYLFEIFVASVEFLRYVFQRYQFLNQLSLAHLFVVLVLSQQTLLAELTHSYISASDFALLLGLSFSLSFWPCMTLLIVSCSFRYSRRKSFSSLVL